jgi:hypothetical protein
LGRLLELRDTVPAEEAGRHRSGDRSPTVVFDEVAAERDAELDLLRLSMTLAHNRGDLTQGMSFWKRTPLTAPVMEHVIHFRMKTATLALYNRIRSRISG